MSDEPRYCHKCEAWHSPTDAGWKAGCASERGKPEVGKSEEMPDAGDADGGSASRYEPKGTRFYSATYKKEMMLVSDGQPFAGWIVYKHPDGQWVSLRKATQADHHELGMAISKAHHSHNPAP